MRNKTATMMAAILLVTVPLAACSGKNETTGGGEPQKSASTNVSTTPLKLSMSINGADNPYITKVGTLENDKYVQEINKRANVQLDFKVKSHKNYAQQMQLMFASGDIPDLVWDAGDSSSPNIAVAVNSGVFMQLDELLEKHKAELPNLMKAIPKEAWEQEKVGGKLYGVPVAYLSNGLNESLYIRKDLLTKYNLQVPTTLDEAVQVMKVFKQNGMKYPYSGREKWSYTSTFIYPFGVAANRWNVVNNELVPDTIRPEMKEAIAFNRKLREEGLMDPETLTTSSTDWTNKIKTGQVGLFTHVPSAFGDWNTGLKTHVPEGEFVIIPALKGPNGAAGAPVSPLISASIYINKNFKEPLRALKFLDWLATEDAQAFLSYGFETKESFKLPTETDKLNEYNFYSSLRFVRDATFNKYTIDLDANGKVLKDFLTNVAPKEGYHAYKVPSDLTTYKKFPELKNNDLFYEYAAKIFLGQLPVDAFDDYVKEYKKRGGEDAIKEATQMLKDGKLIKY